MSIKWLHLSDVHECNQEGYHREAMYDHIVKEVEAANRKPDFIVFTGDVAFAGAKAEYDQLKTRFIAPLKAALPDNCPIFTVPGNHDVDRMAVVRPRLWIEHEDERRLFQEVGAAGMRKRHDALLPRFAAYREFEQAVAAWGEDWLATEVGSVVRLLDLEDKKLAIVGLNTAWLSQDNEDWGRLTAGRTMVDAALRQAANDRPGLLIVLGHHPLDAMTGERPWSDGNFIRRRLEQANALYLHGHLHLSGSQRTGDSLQSVRAIQAPSAFQAGDSDIWRNGIMWGEADFDGGWVTITPLRWNYLNEEYNFDSDAGLNRNLAPGGSAFRFELPGRRIEPPPAQSIPAGWRIVDGKALAAIARRPELRAMIDYFDGGLPDWSTVLADGIRARSVVEAAVAHFRQRHSGAPRPLVELLTGAGGEGKSTALLQTAAALVRDETQHWTCLHREAAAAPFVAKLFDRLEPRQGHAWIVVIDDAENVGRELAAELQRVAPRTDVHLLLAAREADWALRGLTRSLWENAGDFRQLPMPPLDEDDAKRIVGSWDAFGPAAMGRLRGVSVDAAAKALAGHANEHAARAGEGSLLGALLFTRQGEDLKDRVRAFVSPLKGRGGVRGFDLRDIYATIAAMHAVNQLYLSHAVLAFAIACTEDDLDQSLRILRREAMLDSGRTYVLTRHRRIAEVACEVLEEDGYDLRQTYPRLARAAELFGRSRRLGLDMQRWRFDLANHFVAKGKDTWPLARSISKAVYDANPNDPKRLVSYAAVLRSTEAFGDAMVLLKTKGEAFRRHRDLLHEWSVVAGEAGDPGLNAWLAGRSLADDGDELDETRCKLSLASLARAFELLHLSSGRRLFAEAETACGLLGLELRELDATARQHFNRHSRRGNPVETTPSPEKLIGTIHRGVADAADEMDPNNDVSFFLRVLDEPNEYSYRGLMRGTSDGRVTT